LFLLLYSSLVTKIGHLTPRWRVHCRRPSSDNKKADLQVVIIDHHQNVSPMGEHSNLIQAFQLASDLGNAGFLSSFIRQNPLLSINATAHALSLHHHRLVCRINPWLVHNITRRVKSHSAKSSSWIVELVSSLHPPLNCSGFPNPWNITGFLVRFEVCYIPFCWWISAVNYLNTAPKHLPTCYCPIS
jgi:hypothetical protein